MNKKEYYFEEGDFKLFIYYTGSNNPTIIHRNNHEDLERWLSNKNNRGNLKGCSRWVMQDDKGVELRRGGIKTEILIS